MDTETSVIESPQVEPNQSSQLPDNGDVELSEIIAKTFKTEPRQQQSSTRRQVQSKPDQKPEAKPEVKPESKEAPKPADKKPSVFDRLTPEQKPVESKQADAKPASQDFDDGVLENDWKAAKQKRAEFKREAEQARLEAEKLAKELAAYRQRLPDPSEAERLKAEHKEAMDRLALLDFQSHPDFKRQFVEPKNTLVSQAQSILADNGVDAVDLIGLASKPRAEYAKAMSEIESKLNSFDAGEFRLTMRELGKLSEKEKAAIAQHGNIAENFKKQSEQRMRSAFEESYQENQSWLARPYDIPAGIEPEKARELQEFNRSIESIRSNAEKYAFAASDEKTSASLAVKAAQFDFYTQKAIPQMVKDYKEAQSIIEQLTSKIKELESARPGAGFDGGSSGQGQLRDEDLTVEQLVRKTFRS